MAVMCVGCNIPAENDECIITETPTSLVLCNDCLKCILEDESLRVALYEEL